MICRTYWQKMASYYLNQYWVIVIWTLRNKLQWSCNQNTKIFVHENASENIACEMAAILSKGKCVKWWENMLLRAFMNSYLYGYCLIWRHLSDQHHRHGVTWSIFPVPFFRTIITVTSLEGRWPLKSPAFRLFAQPFVQEQTKENIPGLC